MAEAKAGGGGWRGTVGLLFGLLAGLGLLGYVAGAAWLYNHRQAARAAPELGGWAFRNNLALTAALGVLVLGLDVAALGMAALGVAVGPGTPGRRNGVAAGVVGGIVLLGLLAGTAAIVLVAT